MTTTKESLQEEIRSIATGIEEELPMILDDPDASIQQLKDCLALLKMAKKEKTQLQRQEKKKIKDTRDFLVKLSRIFKEDLFIYNGLYIYPGKNSSDNLVGEYLLEISDDYKNLILENVCDGNKEDIFYIPSVLESKVALDSDNPHKSLLSTIKTIKRGSLEYDDIQNHIKEILADIDLDTDLYITLPLLDDPEIFSLKKIFSLKYENYKPVELNIDLLPMVTSETINEVEFCCGEYPTLSGNFPVYYVRFKIPSQYFHILTKYFYF